MIDLPYTFDVLQDEKVILSEYDNHIIRHLSAMKGQFLDQATRGGRRTAAWSISPASRKSRG